MKLMEGASWDSLFLTVVKLVTTLTAIIQTKILSVGLSLTDYGTYSQANVVVSLGTSFLLLGLGDAINFFYNDSKQENDTNKKNEIINTIYGIELIAGIIFISIVVLGRYGISLYFSNDALIALMFIIAFQPMLDNMIYFYQILFVSTGKAKLIALRNLVISVLKLAIITLAVKVFNNIFVIYILLIALNLVQLYIFAVYFKKEGFSINPMRIKRHFVRKILAYGIPMGIFTITTALTRDIDKLVIGYMSNTETVAVYTNCSKLLPLDIIVASFATVLIPYIMKYVSVGDKRNAAKLFKNYLKVGYYSVWTFGVGILIVTSQAISFLYSSEYLTGKYVFIIYIIDSMVKFASMHLVLTASGNSKLLMKYSIISLVANAVLNILLFKTIGLAGPALATLIVTLIYSIMIMRRTIKILGVKRSDILEIKDILLFIITLVICGALFSVADRELLKIGLNQYIAMIMTMGGFGILVLIINFKKIMNVFKAINSLKS